MPEQKTCLMYGCCRPARTNNGYCSDNCESLMTDNARYAEAQEVCAEVRRRRGEETTVPDIKHIDLEAYSMDETTNAERRIHNQKALDNLTVCSLCKRTQEYNVCKDCLKRMANQEIRVTSRPITPEPWATHIFIDAPGCDDETVQVIQAKAERWLKEGGVLCIGGGFPDRQPVALSFGRLEEGAFFCNQIPPSGAHDAPDPQ